MNKGKAVTSYMNGIEKITARIEQDAQADIAAIAAQAEEKASAIRGQYQAEAAQAAEKARADARKAAEQRRQRLEGAAEMEARKLILAQKQACIEKAFAQAKQRLLSLPEEEYVDLLARIAASSAQTGREEVLLNQRDRDAVGAKVVARANQILAKSVAPNLPQELKESKAGKIIDKVVTGANAILQGTAMLTLAEETRDITGGLILRDGSVEINCAFETQLRMLRENMAADVAKVLFR